MSGSEIKVTVDDSAFARIMDNLERVMADQTPLMEIAGAVVVASVQKNFEQGGRPAWAPLSPVTISRRFKQGMKSIKRRRYGGYEVGAKERVVTGSARPLLVQGPAGGLLGSIHFEAGPDQVEVGTNKIYAAVQQFGAAKGAFGSYRLFSYGIGGPRTVPIPWGDIPARPFLGVQREDWEEIRDVVGAFLVRP